MVTALLFTQFGKSLGEGDFLADLGALALGSCCELLGGDLGAWLYAQCAVKGTLVFSGTGDPLRRLFGHDFGILI